MQNKTIKIADNINIKREDLIYWLTEKINKFGDIIIFRTARQRAFNPTTGTLQLLQKNILYIKFLFQKIKRK